MNIDAFVNSTLKESILKALATEHNLSFPASISEVSSEIDLLIIELNFPRIAEIMGQIRMKSTSKNPPILALIPELIGQEESLWLLMHINYQLTIPVDEINLMKIINSMTAKTKYEHINLIGFQSLAFGDNELMINIIDSIHDAFPEIVGIMKLASEKEYKDLFRTCHKHKSSLHILGNPLLNEKLGKLVHDSNHLLELDTIEALSAEVVDIFKNILKDLALLKKELQTL